MAISKKNNIVSIRATHFFLRFHFFQWNKEKNLFTPPFFLFIFIERIANFVSAFMIRLIGSSSPQIHKQKVNSKKQRKFWRQLRGGGRGTTNWRLFQEMRSLLPAFAWWDDKGKKTTVFLYKFFEKQQNGARMNMVIFSNGNFRVETENRNFRGAITRSKGSGGR